MRHISSVIMVAAAYGCGNEAQVTRPAEGPAQLTSVTRYAIAKLPSLGGTQSRGMAINDNGQVAGWSDLADGSRRAVLWPDDQTITNLGKLGGVSSAVPWLGLNNAGMVVGISHTDEVDPLDEDWACELVGFLPQTTNLICRGFVWEDNEMRALPTLGGHHSFGTGVNNHGLAVGWAETEAHDSTCDPNTAQKLQFRAVMWDPKDGGNRKIKTRELPPFGDDATSAATAINDNGQAVGISGDCDQAVGRYSARHAVLWEKNGKVTLLPNLGGTSWHTPMDINAQGDVVGFSNPDEPGDEIGDFISRGFYLPYGAAEAADLGTLTSPFGKDPVSEAFALNSHGQVVGISFGNSAAGPRAFIWENGVLTDLNFLDDSEDVLLSAQDINDAGQITGRLRDQVTGEVLAFIANPIQGETP
jgi:probable HAF family extracellular repeat protein